MSAADLSDMSMMELFRLDAKTQLQSLTSSLLALEGNAAASAELEACMRAAHSLKGAARVVGIDAGVRAAHLMEDSFVAAQRGQMRLQRRHVDVLLRAVDLLQRIADTPEEKISRWNEEARMEVEEIIDALKQMRNAGEEAESPSQMEPARVDALLTEQPPEVAVAVREVMEPLLRVSAESLNHLLGLAGECLVESRWLKPYSKQVLGLRRLNEKSQHWLNDMRDALSGSKADERVTNALAELGACVQGCHEQLTQRHSELEMFEGRTTNLAHQLYDAARVCRMRPFADGVRHFPRMVRDVGRALSKEVRFELLGEDTTVDRDILDRLDAPLGHLLRNAIDHGIESAAERHAAGKREIGVVRLEARHGAGQLLISVSDDGCGIDLDKLRLAIVERKLTTAEIAQKLAEAELLEFLFLPGFTTKKEVSDISGRGVGLDVVQDMIKQVRGTVRVTSQPGKGSCFQLQLPLTLSVIRTLLVEIDGEPYAFPLSNITRILKINKDEVSTLEGRAHFCFKGQHIGLISARQLFGGECHWNDTELAVIVVNDHSNTYGLVMDRILDEKELVVHPLDSRLGKIRDIAAGALMENGSPVLIVDVDDLMRSVDRFVREGRGSRIEEDSGEVATVVRKRVLVIEDSLTVRELERKMLEQAGYEVEVAVDGMDGWNAVRAGQFNLVITDVDMPRMDGIELVRLIRNDPSLKSMPVMIVSYKDREDDRVRGLDAGADHYLTKGQFQDDSLRSAVMDLIGEAAT